MNNKDFEPIAQWIADVVIENKTVKEEVAKYRQKFLKQRYCLDLTDVAEFGSQLFGNILPTSDFGKLFSDRLIAACEHLSK